MPTEPPIGITKKRWSLKDIPIEEVLLHQKQWSANRVLPFTYQVLGEKYGSEKLVYCKMEKLATMGYLEYGVSVRTSWLTEKAERYLVDNGFTCQPKNS